MSFPRAENTAPYDKRYIGCYYYNSYFAKWDKILAIKRPYIKINGTPAIEVPEWVVVSVDSEGKTNGLPRTHRSPMFANRFADKPFEVTAQDLT